MPTDAPVTGALAELAAHHGVAIDFWDWQGRHLPVSVETIRRVLAALGVAADTDEAAELSLRDASVAGWRRTLPPTVVCREGSTPRVPVHVPDGSSVRLDLELEDGTRRTSEQVEHWVEPREVDGRLTGEATFELPGDLPIGWHRLLALVTESDAGPDGAPGALDGGPHGKPADRLVEATLVVTPERLTLPDPLATQAVWGVTAQLYQAVSARSWGLGDLGDLGELAAWTADRGGGFVLPNPLHAAEPVPPMAPSPYLPTTRRFVNPVYLRVEDVPGYATLSADDRTRVDDLARRGRALTAAETIDRDAVWALKSQALALIHAQGLGERRADFEAYREREGDGLLSFATWCAIAGEHGLPWRAWPAQLRRRDSSAVGEYQRAHEPDVEFQMWLQWCIDLQLEQLQRQAIEAGMALGVVQDLAVGVHPDGADGWSLAEVLAAGIEVGAPPDQFNQLGQTWLQPPWRPDRLAEAGYAPYRDMLRTVLRHSGGIRIDHILGLFRLWWVPSGRLATEGTYVRYDHEALMGILVLEAQRAGAVVIGEDLGTVEPWVRDYLRERGVLGTSVLWFEWEDGRPLPPEHYRRLCLASVTTHDLPPTAGYLELEHVAIRERLGLLTRSVQEERAAESASIAKVVAALRERGLLAEDVSAEEVVVALHRWLAQSPSRLLGVALPDLVADRRAINQPGTSDEYPNWRLPLTNAHGQRVHLEDLSGLPLAERIDAIFAPDGTREVG